MITAPGELPDRSHRDAGFERRVREFSPELVLGIWATLLSTPPEHLTAISEALLPNIGLPLLSLHGTQPPQYAALDD